MDRKNGAMDRLDEIINQLGALYTEADKILDSLVERAREVDAPSRRREPAGSLQ
jgi:hypothetical protein